MKLVNKLITIKTANYDSVAKLEVKNYREAHGNYRIVIFYIVL